MTMYTVSKADEIRRINIFLIRYQEFPAERNKAENKLNWKLDGEIITGTYSAIYNGESKIGLVSAYQFIRNDNKTDALTATCAMEMPICRSAH